MLLSICIPVYNAEKFLDVCIESIMKQTYQDFELILVDDGSEDGSLRICKQWETNYPVQIRVVAKENSGSLFTRRVCLKEAKGEYIYIMDADDYLLDMNALQLIMETIQRQQCDMVFFNATNNGTKEFYQFPFADMEVFQGTQLERIHKYLIQKNGLNSLWNKVFHRSLVDWDADYSEYSYMTNGTDYFQSIPIVAHAKRACFLDRVLYFYRTEQNPNSIVHKFSYNVYVSGKTNFFRLVSYSAGWDIEDKEQLLKTACMRSVSTAAYKARLIPKDNLPKRISFLKMISDDIMIKDYFTLNGLTLERKLVVILLRIKAYKLMAALI